jgi:GNAT superfamily N-acetyltransferase
MTTIEAPEGESALTEFILFRDRVYQDRGAKWPTLVPLELPTLTGESPFAEGRTFRPLVAREDGEIVARAAALVDHRYLERWDDAVGHLVMFEAMPGARDATKQLVDAACDWLRGQGMRAARAGFGGGSDLPFVIDDYETLPPMLVRHNPAYYHALLKDAGFESEQGWVDYRIEVTPELVARWTSALESARRAGFEIVPLCDVPEDRRAPMFTQVWNEAFHAHWGVSPFTEDEVALFQSFLGPLGMFDLSVLAFRDDEPVGVLWVTPPSSAMASLAPGRELRPEEHVNFLGIGVREQARGRGVNLAMAAYAYLELARGGATHLSYTLVLDDNWPSRRTAEKLGAHVCANYMVYRRNFSHP